MFTYKDGETLRKSEEVVIREIRMVATSAKKREHVMRKENE